GHLEKAWFRNPHDHDSKNFTRTFARFRGGVFFSSWLASKRFLLMNLYQSLTRISGNFSRLSANLVCMVVSTRALSWFIAASKKGSEWVRQTSSRIPTFARR